MIILFKLLSAFIWAGAGVLIVLLYRIGRFWQSQTGLQAYYQAFLVPLGFFVAAALRYMMTDVGFAGDVLADLLAFFGGISLSLAGYVLLKRMTGGGGPSAPRLRRTAPERVPARRQ